MDKNLIEAGRLALRHEGEEWVAYYALPTSMEGALVLGSIAMGAVVDRPQRKQQFMDLMVEVVSDLLEEATGTRPTWPNPPRLAPEHERSGHS